MSLQVDSGTATLAEAPQGRDAEGRAMVTVVIPVYFAEATIGRLVEQVIEAFRPRYGLQIVLVNDGSTDGTHDACRRLVEDHPDVVTYLRLARNFGEHNAVMAGLHRAEGEYVVIMDDDFQNHPQDGVRLVEEAHAGGFDIVYSRYPKRRHSLPRVLGSKFNGWVANFMIDKPPDLYLSSFKCMRHWLVQQVLSYRGPFPYLDGLALRCTRNIGRVTVEQGERAAGRSGYTSRKLMRLWGNMFVNFSVMPLRASTALGAFFRARRRGPEHGRHVRDAFRAAFALRLAVPRDRRDVLLRGPAPDARHHRRVSRPALPHHQSHATVRGP